MVFAGCISGMTFCKFDPSSLFNTILYLYKNPSELLLQMRPDFSFFNDPSPILNFICSLQKK